jgi:hypothetical protein
VFKLATDQSSGVRREVCIAFCQLVAVHPELLQAHLPQLVEYMLASNQVRAVCLLLSFTMVLDNIGLEAWITPFPSKLNPLLQHCVAEGQ